MSLNKQRDEKQINVHLLTAKLLSVIFSLDLLERSLIVLSLKISFLSCCAFSAAFLHSHDWLYTLKESLVWFLETLNVKMIHFTGSDEQSFTSDFFSVGLS